MPPRQKLDLYKTLGVDPKSSPEDIKKSYKQLALKHHPDKNVDNPNAVQEFQQIGLAYRVLSDPDKRRHYDRYGSTEEADEDMSEDDLMSMFYDVFQDIAGGMQLMGMFAGMSRQELRQMPPFPFPKELFPPGTFPPGMRFARSGPRGMPAGCGMAGMFFGASGRASSKKASKPFRGRGRADVEDDSDSSDGWVTASDDDVDVAGVQSEEAREGEGSQIASGERELEEGEEEEDETSEEGGEGGGEDVAAGDLDGAEEPAVGLTSSGSAEQLQAERLQRPLSVEQQQQQQADLKEPASKQQQPSSAAPPPQLQRDWFSAAKMCNVSEMAALLSLCPELLSTRGAGIGHTALHWCAARGDGAAVRWLLDRHRLEQQRQSPCGLHADSEGCGVNGRNARGSTPLHAAAGNGRTEVVALLLQEPDVDVAAVDEDGRTAAQVALLHGLVSVAALIEGRTSDLAAAPSTAAPDPRSREASEPDSDLRFRHAPDSAVAGSAGPASRPRPADASTRSRSMDPEPSKKHSPEDLLVHAVATEAAPPSGLSADQASGAMLGDHGVPGCRHRIDHPPGQAVRPLASSLTPDDHCGAGGGSSMPPQSRPVVGDAARMEQAPPPCAGPSSVADAAAERERRRAALTAASEAADALEEQREAQRLEAAAAAAVACGVPPSQGRAWLEAARAGDVATLAAMLGTKPELLHYKGEGTNFSFTAHTALHWASSKGHAAAVRWLLAAGASASVINASGSTALHAAADNQQLGCAEVLLLLGSADPQVSDELGSSPRDLLLARGGPAATQRFDVAARAAALLTRHWPWAAGGRIDHEDAFSSVQWSVKDMRLLLAAGAVNSSGMVERVELRAACQQLLTDLLHRLPQLPNVPLPAPRPAPNAELQRDAESSAALPAGLGSPAKKSQQSSQAGPAPRSSKQQAAGQCLSTSSAPASSGIPSAVPAHGAGDPVQGSGGNRQQPEAAADAAVEAAKAKGNAAYAQGDYKKAVSHYTMAIRLCKRPSAVLLSNRSAAYSCMRYFGRAIEDAEEAIKLDPSPKFLVRKAAAHLGMGHWEEAAGSYRRALEASPGYPAALQGLEDVRRRQAEARSQ